MRTEKFTAVGTGIWDWEPWTSLGTVARLVWMAIYTSPDSKRTVPGLFHGGIAALAEVAKLRPEDVYQGVEELLEADMIELDQKKRIIRLTQLPDRCERPYNGDHIRGWWARFITVTSCAVRDAHVRLLRWLVEGTSLTPNIETAWRETFGTIAVPALRKRGVRTLGDLGTSNENVVQQNLFAPPPSDYLLPQEPLRSGPVDNLPDCSVPKEINNFGHRVEHLPGMVSERERDRVLDLVPDSGSPDLECTVVADRVHAPSSTPPSPTLVTVGALLIAGTGSDSHYRESPELQAALQQAADHLTHCGITSSDLAHVQHARISGRVPRDARWYSDPENVRKAIRTGVQLRSEALERSRVLAEIMAGGV